MAIKSNGFKYSMLSKGLCLFFALLFAFLSTACTAAAAVKILFTGDLSSGVAVENTHAYCEYTSAVLYRILSVLRVGNEADRLKAQKEEFIEKALKAYRNAVAAGKDFFHFGSDLTWDDYFDFAIDLDEKHDEDTVRSLLEEQYDEAVEYAVYRTGEESRIPLGSGVAYYIKTAGGSVYTNYASAARDKSFSKENHTLVFNKNGLKSRGFDDALKKVRNGFFGSAFSNSLKQTFLSEAEGGEVYIRIFESQGTVLGRLLRCGELVNRYDFTGAVVFALLSLAAAVLFLVAAARLSGHSYGQEGIRLSALDKMPTDLHFLFSAAFTAAAAAGAVICCVYGFSLVDVQNELLFGTLCELPFSETAGLLCALCGALSFLFFTLWVCSTARLKKAGRSFFGKFLICYLVRALLRVGKFFARKIKAFFSVLFYQPQKFKRLFLLLFILIEGASLVLLLLGIGFVDLGDEDMAFFCLASAVLLQAVPAYFIVRYAVFLDKIIVAAEGRIAPDVKLDKLPASLRCLQENITVTNAELDAAVARALKDERMKTELITNVSHDLKTPLTSIITYVDLLKRCDVQGEDAKKYIEVLSDKSARLKTLVEDLVEASKASSGAVTLHMVRLDLTQLVMQAVGEMTDDFMKNGLELILNEPDKKPVVFADSQKTYRVIENLFSNARKYSVRGSRVYVEVGEENGMGFMRVKNFSKDQLNITPEELTERFVRGDASRTDGGSGLGLAIAKDLCALQNGELKIDIDGDLFKATVCLHTASV